MSSIAVYNAFIESVKQMTGLVIESYTNLEALAHEKTEHHEIIDSLETLITAHNVYVDYIKYHGYCREPILNVQKRLALEFERYMTLVYSSNPKPELTKQLSVVCELGKKYAHKTKFAVMSIPIENLDLHDPTV